MQNRILLIIVVLLSITYLLVSSSTHNTTLFFPNKEESPNIAVKDTSNGKIEEMDLEEYIVGVVASEMPASFNIEALKAQAIASRTYAVYKISTSSGEFDVVTDVTNQSYITVDKMKTKWGSEFNKYYNKIKSAVEATKNKILKYNDKVIEAYYFSMSNGYTEKASLVFSEDRDYLQSVESSYETKLNNFEVTTTMSKNDFCTKLNIDCSNIVIGKIERSDTSRVNNITINNKTFKGTEVRKLLKLRSTDFNIFINANNVSITTKGYGHGVGMSQYGANGMAGVGYNYEEILEYFYKNAKISSI